jgi:hypothetical protein
MGGGEEIWSETTHGGLLKEMFGQYPTFRDARLREVTFAPQDNAIELTVDYTDTMHDGPDSLSVRIRLCWTGIQNLKLPVSENYLSNLTLRRRGDYIFAEFEFGFGLSGFVESERLEATLEKVDPLMEDEGPIVLRYR